MYSQNEQPSLTLLTRASVSYKLRSAAEFILILSTPHSTQEH